MLQELRKTAINSIVFIFFYIAMYCFFLYEFIIHLK